MFSGYDSQCLALRRAGVPFDLVAWSEIDRHAVAAHDALFPEYAGRNLGDVSRIDWGAVEGDIDLLTYSSPCQDFSNAGRLAGGEEGSGTRSSLLWEVKRAVLAKRPRYLLMENVKNLVSRRFMPTFKLWLDWLSGQGYESFWKVLNAKDYGVPQNRERVFAVSLRDGGWYSFPKPAPLERRLKDLLEDGVDERYYLDQKRVDGFVDALPEEQRRRLERGE